MLLRWFESPAAALVSFAAAVASLGQLAVAGSRAASRITKNAGDQGRARAALLLALAAVALPLAWHPVVAEVGRYGEAGLTGELYPLVVTGTAVAGALVLLVTAEARTRAPWYAWAMTAGGLASTALLAGLYAA